MWVKDFVIGYHLCPFAEAVYSDNSVRYVVSEMTTEEEFFEKLKYEVCYWILEYYMAIH